MVGRKSLDAPNEYLGKEDTIAIDDLGSGKKETELIDKIIPGDNPAYEAFMHEPVTIVVHESTDENEVDLVQVWVNGQPAFFQRGQPTITKRYFVERLARAKRTSYSQNIDERLGEAMNNLKPRHALKYPFSVIEDKNPKGGAWLRQILAERT